jgi:hypothetical protein
MPGALFFILIVAIGVVLAAFTGTIFLLIPFVVIAFGVLAVPPIVAAMHKRGAADAAPAPPQAGTPSTGEASYEPVQQPGQRSV